MKTNPKPTRPYPSTDNASGNAPANLSGKAGRWFGRSIVSAVLVATLVACGGGSGGDGASVDVATIPESRPQAQRFLVQSTFGPTDADTDRVMALGYRGWIEDQFTRPQVSHREYWDASNTAGSRLAAPVTAGEREIFDSFYINALAGNDQLRQRVTFALSEIFVISLADGNVSQFPRGVAGYMDTLAANAFGNYRDLLQAVALHPMMGLYLTHLRNQKGDPAKGRVPDQNFARESMQLFSVGLQQLNTDGTVKVDSSGKPLDTYASADVMGLANVFTGFSWSGPDTSDGRFNGGGTPADLNRMWMPMQAYAKYHSTTDKTFLGTTLAGGGSADTDLKAALDALSNHPNVGPFIGKQLIQRLVTSNPGPAYVGRVAAAFKDNGSGVRGDMKAVIRAVLLDPEARDASIATSPGFGKIREPVLRMTAFLRAFNATSDSGKFLIGRTDDPGSQLGQSPMRAPSVFNFFRPGYVAPGSATEGSGLVAPEMQITHETSIVGFSNFMRAAVQSGIGQNGVDSKATRRDVQPNYTAEIGMADDATALVDRVMARLVPDAPSDLRKEILDGVASITVPALRADSSNQTAVDNARKNRVYTAVLLTLVSPEFTVQR